jgi:hypothetical protein
VLLDGAARQDADLAEIDSVVDFGPGQFFVTILGSGTAWHDGVSWTIFEGTDSKMNVGISSQSYLTTKTRKNEAGDYSYDRISKGLHLAGVAGGAYGGWYVFDEGSTTRGQLVGVYTR